MAEATLSHYAEYYALRGAVAALDRLSLRQAGRIGEWLGALGYRPFGIRRAVVERQVRAALPELSDADVHRVAREFTVSAMVDGFAGAASDAGDRAGWTTR